MSTPPIAREPDAPPSLRCVLVTPSTRHLLTAMLGHLEVSLGGAVSPALHEAVAADAARGDHRVVAIVALIEAEAAGFVVATVETARYWRTALARRPTLLWRVLRARLGASMRGAGRRGATVPRSASDPAAPAGGGADGVPISEAAAAPYQWQDDGADLVKIAFIGVMPEFRRRGVGAALYQALFEAAAHRGAHTVLARIASDNVASLWLHHRAGWRLFRDRQGVFAVYQLPDRAAAPHAPVT